MKKLFLVVLAIIGSVGYIKATHMSGSDMEFKLMGKDTLKVVLRVYRDCNGIPINTSPALSISTVGCTPAKSVSVTMTQTLVQPVRFMCSTQKNICEGGSFQFGMEEHRFEATIYLQQVFSGGLDSTCCNLYIVYQECCRNGSITNVVPANFYIDAQINRCLRPNNTTPRFLNQPVAVVCNGQPTTFNNGINDTTDHDSISVVMADPLQGPNGPLTWNGTYTKDRPLTFLGFPNQNLPFPAGFHLDSATGDLGFTSTAIQQPVLAFMITERALVNGTWQVISVTRRDVQFFSYQCPANNPPTVWVNGSNTGPWSYIACATSPFCLTFKGNDADAIDTTRLMMTGIPTGATFNNVNKTDSTCTIRLDTAQFCWTPTISQTSSLPYYFQVKVYDKTCPVPGSMIKSVAIKVRIYAPITGSIQSSAISPIKRQISFSRTDTNSALTPSYLWTVSATPGAYNSTGASSYSTQSFQHTFPSGGKYVVKLQITVPGAYCDVTKFDTINACILGASLGNDVTSCNAINSTVSTSIQNNAGPVKYAWYRFDSGSPRDTLSDTTAAISVSLSNANNSYTRRVVNYIVQCRDSFGCATADTIVFTLNKPVALNGATHDTTVCQGTNVTFGFTPQIASSSIRYKWNNNKTTNFITEQNAAWYVLSAYNPDSSCITQDSVQLHTIAYPNASAGSDQYICTGTPYTLTGTGGTSRQWFVYGQSTALTNLIVAPTTQTAYVLKTQNQQNGVSCYNTDTMSIFVANYPTASAGSDQYLCAGTPYTLIGTGGSSRQWFEAGQINPLGNLTVSPATQTAYVVKTMNQLGTASCYNTDTMIIFTGPKAQITMPAFSSSYCTTLGSISLSGQTPVTGGTGVWTSSKPGCLGGNNFNVTCAGAGFHFVFYTFTTDTYNCVSRDTATIKVVNPPVIVFNTPANTCINSTPFTLAALPNSGGTGAWSSSAASCLNAGVFDPACAGLGTHKLYYSYSNGVGCNSSDSTSINVLPLPTGNFGSNITSGKAPLIVLFSDSSTGISGRLWNFGDTASTSNAAIIKSPAHTYKQSGVYTVQLVININTSGTVCYDTIVKPNYITVTGPGVGIQQLQQKQVHIYPNPAKDGFTIAAEQDQYTIRLFDMTGREVQHTTQSGSELHVQRNNLPAGIYTVRVSGLNNNVFVAKVAFE